VGQPLRYRQAGKECQPLVLIISAYLLSGQIVINAAAPLLDELGNVIALTDSAGNTIETYAYDVYGRADKTSNVGNPYFFTARRFDTETGLYYYRARYYSPIIGRFLQVDAIGYQDGMNLYAYCSNNSIIFVDPR